MTKKENATHIEILEIGKGLMATKGFSSVGLSQILKAANVPKGSFYHYFSSKEDFGQEVINFYFENYFQTIDKLFNSNETNALERVLSYFKLWLETQSHQSLEQKCLVVKLSAEVSDLSEKMRSALLKGSSEVVEKIADVISKGIDDGSIIEQCPHSTATLLYHMWLGASLMAKLHRSEDQLEQCMEQTVAILTTKKVMT